MPNCVPLPIPANHSRVLVVEDECGIRELLCEVLRAHGLDVVEASTADEAWRFLQNGGHADAVFSDVAMPGTMNGLELVRRIRQDYPRIRTVLTSGHGAPPRTGQFGQFLPKPFGLESAARLLLGMLAQPEL
jgi:CheY-like chemotaxis protein